MANENIARSTKPRNDLTAEFVRTILDYDPATGDLSWTRSSCWHNLCVGKPAGYVRNDRSILLQIFGRKYLAHRIIWLLMKGAWPSNEIDHISGDPSDNRWANLREASHSENCKNRKINSTNTSGSKGVYCVVQNNKWRAQIMLNGKRKSLGLFSDITAASSAYEKAAEEFFGEFKRRS